MIYQAKWTVFALAFITACSCRPTADQGCNVVLNLIPPADPLYEMADSASLKIDAPDIQSPFLAVYEMDPDNGARPALAGFGLGDRWVLVSGQPLEYNYDRRDRYNIGDLLPRIIRFLLGIRAGGAFSLIPGSGAFEREYRGITDSPALALEGTPRQ